MTQLPISLSSAPGDIIGNFTTFEGRPLDALNVHSFARVPWILSLNASHCCKMISVNNDIYNIKCNYLWPRQNLLENLSVQNFFAEYIFMAVNIVERPTFERRAVHFDRGVFANVILIYSLRRQNFESD